ncbi:MAG: HAMP domain-containing histidine kinase [Psychroserpens sp.]|nr:HAMP domain-containing histidine kinase [Psychroserpens sp.]
MNDSKYRYILYIISTVILATIGMQVYWNYINYKANKQQLINEVQTSLDKAVDDYYAALAERTTLGIFLEGDNQKDAFKEGSDLQKILKSIDEDDHSFTNLDSINVSDMEGITILRGFKADSMSKAQNEKNTPVSPEVFKKKIDSIKIEAGDLNPSKFDFLTSKIIVSISNDSLDLKEIDRLVTEEFNRKKLSIDHYLKYEDGKGDSIFTDSLFLSPNHLKTTSKSTFLPKGSTLQISFSNETQTILRRILGGILISTLLVLAVISSLFYLLNIIKHQKQLSEVKNDLISNITHEFKTPIATIGVALESLQNFNAIEDKTKTKNYLDMSSSQLSKLNAMVEKLLETATLDSENLKLNKERYDLSEVLNSIIEKHQMQSEKSIETDIQDLVFANVDIFHIENAFNNIIDNAIKYGGGIISISLQGKSSQIEFKVSDNGTSLTKAHKERIFEKFYRVPKGNTHDVKGFGIGLYYTNKIIEKHGGTIDLELDKSKTTFKITLPYA